jgi:methylase of polypeptide subunit release factors
VTQVNLTRIGLSLHQPFHWLAEFYQIIHGNGGFDVIIGNPPYIEYNKKDPKTKKAVSDCYKLINIKRLIVAISMPL